MLMVNGIFHTMDSVGSVVQAVAIKDGKIVQVGTTEDLLFEFKADTVFDLKGRSVFPGFIDAHCHFYGFASNLRQADLVATRSWGEVLTRVDSFAKGNKEGWLLGRGWDQNDWEDKNYPDNTELNARFPNRPVLLKRIDGHAALANQAALEAAGITSESRVSGGKIFKDARGNLTGMLLDNAVDMVEKVVPPPSDKEMAALLQKTEKLLFANGITTVSDAGLELHMIELIDSLQKSGALQVRVYAMANPTEENFKRWLPNGPYRTEKLSVSAFKVYADGALGSRGACLLEPYKDAPEQTGFLLHDIPYYHDLAKKIHDAGFQMNTHCIGDSAIRFMLHVYGNVLAGANNRRWRIEHAQVVAPSDFRLFDTFDVIPSVQPTHATSDMAWAEDRIGKIRLNGAYAYKTLLKQNGFIAFGTDFPVEQINPMHTLFAATQRMDTTGYPYGGFMAHEAVGLDTALRAITIWAAYANMEDGFKGSLEPGKLADLVVLESDPFGLDSKSLYHLKVDYTLVGGKIHYNRSE